MTVDDFSSLASCYAEVNGRVWPGADCHEVRQNQIMEDQFDTVITCYQAIGTALAKASSGPWDRISVDATLDGARVDAIVSCWKDEAEEPICYLTGVPRLASHIYDLARLVSTEKQGFFKECHFNLKKDGKFDVNFIY